jgi:alkylation response protein AidB-like acyl-CoA dehydrogenase
VDFEFSAEQELLRETTRRFFAERASIAGHVRPRLGDGVGLDGAVWSGLAELGVLGLMVGPPAGAPDLVSAGVVVEEAGRALLPEPYLMSAVGAATALRSAADSTEIVELRHAVADGTEVATLAWLEPGQRYEWRSPSVRARATGDEWRISGVKEPVLSARAATKIIVTAHDGEGLALFVVDARELDESARWSIDSVDLTRASGGIELDDTPATRLDVTQPVAATRTLLDVAGLCLALDGVGAASAVLDMTVEHAKQRHQFGVPIGSFQAVQHLCADMLRDLEMARLGAYYALWAGQAAGDDELHRAATMAQAYAAEVLPRIGETAIQVFGGIGFTWEHDVHLFYRRLLGAAALFSDAEAQYAELARLVLD